MSQNETMPVGSLSALKAMLKSGATEKQTVEVIAFSDASTTIMANAIRAGISPEAIVASLYVSLASACGTFSMPIEATVAALEAARVANAPTLDEDLAQIVAEEMAKGVTKH